MTSVPTKTKRQKNPDTPEATSKYYITNGRMLPEVIACKAAGKMSDKLAEMLMMLTRKYAQRPCFSGYTYKEDMISDALTNLCHNALKFDPAKSSNPFAFYTSCINNSFLQTLNVEKKHRRIRDQMLIEIGENPSFNFQEEAKAQNDDSGGEFKSELNELKDQILEAKIRIATEAAQAAELALLNAQTEAQIVDEEGIPNISLLEFDDDTELIIETK